MLVLGAATSVQAAEKFCSQPPYNGVIDGDVLGTPPTQITIDTHCQFLNWPQSNPLTTTINFQTNDPSVYLIIFDNVWYEGNLACSNIPHKLWAVNSGGFDSKCQDVMIPAETIQKDSPGSTATVGVPFTYTLTMPSMNYPAGDPSPNEIGNVTLLDDLTATGVDLTFVSLNAYYKDSLAPVTFLPETDPLAQGGVWTPKNLSYQPLPVISAGDQIIVEITVVLDDTPANLANTQFTNTAKWWFSRSIDINEDGVIDPATEFFDPLPGESGISAPMTIVEPDLQVSKSSTSTALNIGVPATFSIDVANVGGADAWNATIMDQLPDFPTAGMCPTAQAEIDDLEDSMSVGILGTDGVTRTLGNGTDYAFAYSATACELTLIMTSVAAVIAPGEHLIISYVGQLDPDTTGDGLDLTNVAGATEWFSADPAGSHPYRTYVETLTDGSPGVGDFQDSHTVVTALHGYYFEKTVENVTTGVGPGPDITAFPGDTLRYRLRLFNVDETIDGITISDTLDLTYLDETSFTVNTQPPGTNIPVFNSATGEILLQGDPSALNVSNGDELVLEFEIDLLSPIAAGTQVSNQAELTADQGTPADTTDDFYTKSDDPYSAVLPYTNNVADPDVAGDENATIVTIEAPGALSKANPPTSSVTIGERFTYTVTVPASPVNTPLYDVTVRDILPAEVELGFVTAWLVSDGRTLSNTSADPSELVIEDDTVGIDIPAGGQEEIKITLELQNTTGNQSTSETGLSFGNTASYTYSRINDSTDPQLSGDPDSTGGLAVVEPTLSAAKQVSFASPAGKLNTDAATVGDVLQYVVTVDNNGDSTAYDVNVVDTLPPELAFDSAFTPTATIDGSAVSGFVTTPDGEPEGPLVWGQGNGDGSLDIPPGGQLVLTYHATVLAATAPSIVNSVTVDWTSLDGPNTSERTGIGCPVISAPDDYCLGPVSAEPIATVDNTFITKVVASDSYSEPVAGSDPVLRVGDTVDYELVLNLQEYTTQDVRVEDLLPAGMVLESFTIDPGATPFSYTMVSSPAAGATGTLVWDFGDITNPPDGTALDPLVIRYVARVITDPAPAGLDTSSSQLLSNGAQLSYYGGDPVLYPGRLTAAADIEVRQPQMSAISKTDLGSGRIGTGTSGDPYQVSVADDEMLFELESCNNGLSPAYGVVILDQLAWELDEGDLAAAPMVAIGAAELIAGADYFYTAPARGGEMRIELQDSAPVNPGECVTVNYTMGFHTDLTSETSWSNQASLPEYRSLPLAGSGRVYSPADLAAVWMTNLVSAAPLSKELLSPAGGEATVGEEVVYRITVPADPVNVALQDVQVSDTLHGALEYVGATAVDSGGVVVSLTDASTAGQVELGIAQIPAGEQITITLTTRVANNAQAAAGSSFSNTASYTYTGIPAGTVTADSSEVLTLVEPTLALGKTVVNLSNPGAPPNAGDTLRYSLSFTATGGVAGDNFSEAFDLLIEDSLSLGLAYQNGTATVNGSGNSIADPATNGGDGVTVAQTLTWSLSDATADIDVAEGAVVAVTYDALVLDLVTSGQSLTNTATVQWTGLDGDSAFERNGSGTPVENDYFAGPVTTTVTPVDNTMFTKTRLADTWAAADGNVRVGDIVEYELRLHLDEGSYTGLTLSDQLPRGLQFEQVVSINGETAAPYSPVAPFSHAPIAVPIESGDATTGPTTITWTVGDLTNAGDNNSANDEFVVIYRARVLNDVLAQADITPLGNTATLNYSTAAGANSLSDSAIISLLQPNLTVTKSAAPAGGDISLSAGEEITYTVDVNNSGDAPAYDTVVRDVLPTGLRDGGVTATSITLQPSGTVLPLLQPIYDSASGTATWNFDTGLAGAYTIPANQMLRIIYTAYADADIAPGLSLTNSVQATDYYSFDDEDTPTVAGLNGVRQHYGPSNTAGFMLSTPLPGAPLKQNPADTSVAIGDTFTYTVTVPVEPLPTALHDVRILDDLTAIAADVTLVSVDKLSGSGAWTPVNIGTATNLIIADTTGGIDIPASEQITVGITLRLDNTSGNQAGDALVNTASYTYNQVNGDNGSQLNGGDSTTAAITVVEPELTVVKTATPLSNPVTGGSLVEFSVTIENTGGGTAYDVNVVDTLPAELSFYGGFTPTATIDAASVPGFVSAPAGTPGGPLIWGEGNGDGSLDLPPNGTLVITYRTQVQVSTAATVENQVWANWTSQDGANPDERSGAGCPSVTLPDDYCTGPATAPVTITDANNLNKLIVSDSYVDATSTADDATVRIGDTVTYRLELNLAEGSTTAVQVEDILPAGMAFENLVGISPASGGNFTYSVVSQPGAGDTGTLAWDLGDIVNQPSNDGTPVDTLAIEYEARILPDAGIAQAPSDTLTNTATLTYLDGSGTPVVDPGRLESQASLTVWQPVMDGPRKTDRLGRTGTSATPLNVNVASDVMQFRLETCNASGLAPAYGVVLTDVLASQLDETSLSAPVVSINGTPLSAGDYNYIPPAGRGGTLTVELQTPVQAGQCLTVDYDIGFHTDFGPNQVWNNSVTLDEFWSLPLQSGQQYTQQGPAQFFMTNIASVTPLEKTLVSPSEATVGDEVIYQITVPATPVNATMDNVQVSDTLHGALEYVSATAVDSGGVGVILTDTSTAGQVEVGVLQIPAGEQITITLTTRVVNNDQANAGTSFSNSASYTYAGIPAGAVTADSSEALTVVEPALTIAKSVSNVSNPGAPPNPGDTLRYSLTFTAAGGASGDNFSDAFDLLIEDNLSLGLSYQNGSASVDGSGNSIADPATNGGDGVGAAQTLTWSLSDATADIDVTEGTVVTVNYDVLVLGGVLPGQSLSNSAIVQWTGLDGTTVLERDGSASQPEDDYVAGPATSTATTEFAVSIAKSVDNVTSSQSPATDATPGDTLHYTLTVSNQSIAPLSNASVVDELAAEFAPGSLQLLSVSDGGADSSNTDSSGGANGTGIVDIRNLTLSAQGDAGDTVTIEFEARLAAVITDGTAVLNRAQLTGDNLSALDSNETSTLISSAPNFQIFKTSEDLSDDPDELLAGETLRYTLTVKNIGTENAVDVSLRDQIPANTTYITGSTTLNGVAVPDPSPGVFPLQGGMLINAPEDPTPGVMRADTSATADNVATVTFDVSVNDGVVQGAEISNQGFVVGTGVGSGPVTEQPSDDPDTPTADDPTVDLIGRLPRIDAHKIVDLETDLVSPGIVDPGDELRYTITISNTGTEAATGVVFTDTVPDNTTYVADSVSLNGQPVAQPDGGVSPLVNGISIHSSDQGSGSGILSAGGGAVVSFVVRVDNGVAPGTVISNQGLVSSSEVPNEATDADGIDSNGDQPTEIPVGDAQMLAITKEVFVVGGGLAEANSELQYVISVANNGTVPATNVVITDTLDASISLIPGTATLDDSGSGVTFSEPLLTADYSSVYGDLAPGSSATLEFTAVVDSSLPIGTTIPNTAEVSYSAGQTDSASANIDVGGTPGSGSLNGRVWHDASLNYIYDNQESALEGWIVDVYRNDQLLATVTTNSEGFYQFSGLAPNDPATDPYRLRFRAQGRSVSLGQAHSAFTDGPQRISDIALASGSNLQNLNLPIQPNGIVYNSVLRTPISGAVVTMLNAGNDAPLPAECFEDPAQQNQATTADGFYKFDLKFGQSSCQPGDDYLIQVVEPASGYVAAPSQIIPPRSSEDSPAFSVASCPGTADDAIAATADRCEAQALSTAPALDVDARSPGTHYYLHLTLSDGQIPGESQLFNNHIPIDPELDSAVSITKTAAVVNVSRGDLVPYTITINNSLAILLQDLSVVDTFPAGFKYVAGSARFDGTAREPAINGRQLRWDSLDLASNEQHTIKLLLSVGSGVSEAEYVNRAQVVSTLSGQPVSEIATATVRVVPDPTLDCSDITGKVFDDANRNGFQDGDEEGLPGVRLATVRGLVITSDEHGRFHLACAIVPNQDRGSNVILKLDDRSLPSGYRVTTENPRVQRATRGKIIKFNFGAAIHRVVRLDIADGVFQADSTEIRLQWLSRFDLLMEQLRKAPSILRIAYLADVEDEDLVDDRIQAVKKKVEAAWDKTDCCEELIIETEVYWRLGSPPDGLL